MEGTVTIYDKWPFLIWQIIDEEEVQVQAGWNVQCYIELPSGNRSGLHYVDLPADATDEQIKEAILAQYQ